MKRTIKTTVKINKQELLNQINNSSEDDTIDLDISNLDTIKVIESNNGKRYYKNNKLHKDDGPAIDYSTYKMWYVDGKAHRLDGPALERKDDFKAWYIDGILFCDNETIFNNRLARFNNEK